MVLHTCPEALAPSLTAFFNFSLYKGDIPDDWRLARVIPIYKKGPRNDIYNYRPISVTCLISKCLERVVAHRILLHLRANNLLNPNQHGFLKGKSSITLLSHVLDDWYQSLDKRHIKQIDVITLDWAKAFDCVPHDRLYDKLYLVHIRGLMRSWIRSFLRCRFQSVAFRGQESDPQPVTSGVIQGSVLGPLLFIIFMLDLSNAVSSPHALYADDSTMYREIVNEEDSAKLQADLCSIELWCRNNRMDLNVGKCTYTRITRSSSPLLSAYEINGEVIPSKNDFKLLGVWISSDLKWNFHTESVRCRAIKVLWMIARCYRPKYASAIRLLYLTMVRSILLYGTPAWHPTSKANLEKLERVQGRATKLIMGYKRTAPVSAETRLISCKLPSINNYIEQADLKFLSKCLSGACDFQFFRVDRVSVRSRRQGLRGGNSLLTHPKGVSNAYLSSLIPRCVAAFNALPEKTRRELLPL